MPAQLRNRSILLLSLATTLLLPACAGDAAKGEATGKTDKADPSKGEPAAKIEAEGKPVEGDQKVAVAEGSGDEEKQYDLQIDPPAATVGAEGKVSIKIVPRGVWHMNLDYPTSLSVEPPAGVTVGKPKQKKEDAIKIEEQVAEFAVAFTASEAGDKTFTGEFKFAVCEEDTCVPKTEKLQFVVAVK
ncbi:hypothetical protein ACNOYE_34945 [Nannocystaceae bacterium ST9]